MPGLRRQAAQKTVFAPPRAVVAFGVTHQDHSALAAQHFAKMLTGELAALVVVGGDEADESLRP